MKVLFIIPSLLCGGAEKLISDILQNFDYRNFEVSLMTFYRESVYDVPKQVRRLVPFCMDNRSFAIRSRLFGKRINNMINDKNIESCVDDYDCICSFLEGFSVNVHFKLFSHSKRNITFVHTDLSKYSDSFSQFDINPAEVYSKMDCIAFVSENSKNSFNQVLPNVSANKVVLRNFIDTDRVLQLSKDSVGYQKDCPTIVSVGRVEKVKGFDLFIDICKELKDLIAKFKILIIGDGTDYARLNKLVAENDLSEYIHLLGFQRNPYPYIAMSDVFVSTSIAEGFSLVLCEAMTLGIPVIATKTDGAKELLGDGSGLLESRDAKSIASDIYKLLKDSMLYRNLQIKGLDKSQSFDKSSYLKNLYSIIKG